MPDESAEALAPAPKKATIISGPATSIPQDGSLVVVAEGRKFTVNDDGELVRAQLYVDGYPAGADIYYRTDPLTQFPADAKRVVTLGVDVGQAGFAGLTKKPGSIMVGPASTIYGAINVAFLEGCTQIQVVGASDLEKRKLQPFLDAIATDPFAPAEVEVSFA